MAKVFIIAEAGVNHNGSLVLAKRLIDAAKNAGADAVKFQTFRAKELAVPEAATASYQRKHSKTVSQYAMLKKLELADKEFAALSAYAKRKGILFLSTPFDDQSADYLHKLGIKLFKISSGDLNNLPFLSRIAKFGKPIILSTGMSNLPEIKEAVKTIFGAGNKKLTLLHCTSSYPARLEEVNLKAIGLLKRSFGLPVGYSDHTKGLEVAVAATALGAVVIEKHFTLDSTMKGPDHCMSLEPDELKEMARMIRNVETALGIEAKRLQASEREIRLVARKSIVAACDIPKGAKIVVDMLTIKRPGTGISPNQLNKLIGKRARTDMKKDELLNWENLDGSR